MTNSNTELWVLEWFYLIFLKSKDSFGYRRCVARRGEPESPSPNAPLAHWQLLETEVFARGGLKVRIRTSLERYFGPPDPHNLVNHIVDQRLTNRGASPWLWCCRNSIPQLTVKCWKTPLKSITI